MLRPTRLSREVTENEACNTGGKVPQILASRKQPGGSVSFISSSLFLSLIAKVSEKLICQQPKNILY